MAAMRPVSERPEKRPIDCPAPDQPGDVAEQQRAIVETVPIGCMFDQMKQRVGGRGISDLAARLPKPHQPIPEQRILARLIAVTALAIVEETKMYLHCHARRRRACRRHLVQEVECGFLAALALFDLAIAICIQQAPRFHRAGRECRCRAEGGVRAGDRRPYRDKRLSRLQRLCRPPRKARAASRVRRLREGLPWPGRADVPSAGPRQGRESSRGPVPASARAAAPACAAGPSVPGRPRRDRPAPRTDPHRWAAPPQSGRAATARACCRSSASFAAETAKGASRRHGFLVTPKACRIKAQFQYLAPDRRAAGSAARIRSGAPRASADDRP